MSDCPRGLRGKRLAVFGCSDRSTEIAAHSRTGAAHEKAHGLPCAVTGADAGAVSAAPSAIMKSVRAFDIARSPFDVLIFASIEWIWDREPAAPRRFRNSVPGAEQNQHVPAVIPYWP